MRVDLCVVWHSVRPLALACAVSWLSLGGCLLAVILAAQSASGSFAVAGAAVAVVSVGIGALAPFRGRLVDRRGTNAILPLVARICSAERCCWLDASTAIALARCSVAQRCSDLRRRR
jgi:hypothetical protein